MQTSKPTADSSMPALFHQFLAYDKKNPPAAPTPGSYVSDNYSVYLSPGAAITATSSVKSTILHNNAAITACTTVTNTTLHENSAVSSCSPLSSLCVCDSSTITASSVTNTLLMAHSHVSDSHTMANSILGPSSHMSCGETHCSLLGPMCNQHHQSLLISVIAPHGRINVGYGANVGSNHTGRSADQECYLGEGKSGREHAQARRWTGAANAIKSLRATSGELERSCEGQARTGGERMGGEHGERDWLKAP